MNRISRYIQLSVLLSVLMSFMALSTAAFAKDNVNVTVRLIKASSDGSKEKKVPAGLHELRDDLESFPYNVFKQVSAKNTKTSIGSTSKIGLAYGLKVDITPVSSSGQMHSISVKLQESDGRTLVNMTIRTRPGSYTLIGGPKIDGSVLILAVTAR